MSTALTELHQHTASLLERVTAPVSPALVFSLRQIENNCTRLSRLFQSTLGSRVRTYFPLKVAPCAEVAQTIAEHGYGVEVISSRERELARIAGASSLILSGNLKTEALLSAAIRERDDFVVCESLEELARVSRLASGLGTRQSVLLRLKVTPRRRLGMSPAQAIAVWTQSSKYPGCALAGLHVHPGSNITWERAQQTIDVVRLTAGAIARAGGAIRFLDFGSGLPAMSTGYDDLAKRLSAFAAIAATHDATVIVEPGRPLVGDAAVLVSTITEIRREERQVTIDTAAYVLPGPCRSGQLLLLRRQGSTDLELLTVTEPRQGAHRLCGIWPAEGDSIWVDGLTNCAVDDQIIFPCAGAYSLGFLGELSFGDFTPTFVRQ